MYAILTSDVVDVYAVQLYNGPRWLVESYTVTLDGLMQVSVQDAQNFNEIQLIIMGVEGKSERAKG